MSYLQPNHLASPKGRSLWWRRLFNFWPLLFWMGAALLALWTYRKGVVFHRMNGAVDVYQENVSPIEDGNFDRLAEGIRRGVQVADGQPVAYMRDDILKESLSILESEIKTGRVVRIKNYNDDILKVDAELRRIRVELASAQDELDATETEIKEMKARMAALKMSSEAQAMMLSGPVFSSFNIKLAKYKAIIRERTKDKTDVEKDRKRIENERDALANETDLSKIAERNQGGQLAELTHRIERLTLKATLGGTVDRILKEPGEYVKQGEGILKVVGAPKQIIGFLAQDQVGQVENGRKVWITPTSDRTKIYDSKVLFLAPRMNSVPDSTAPSNSRLFGRDVVCEYPKEGKLLPGQTVIIWIDPPGDIPLVNQLFSNKDSDPGK